MGEDKRKAMREAVLFFFIQILNYGLITFNFRAIAQANVMNSVGSDLIFASLGFFVIRRIARSESSILSWIGYTAGSGIGTYIGIVVSQAWLGK
jgi:hypothetical protein